mmetsp:Transcript_72427/g.120730  ORF Transcript_72427/g.120730 Transcript_72427/m.120730 type:complete len:436 (-) Transcript_72427:57-1364(-)
MRRRRGAAGRINVQPASRHVGEAARLIEFRRRLKAVHVDVLEPHVVAGILCGAQKTRHRPWANVAHSAVSPRDWAEKAAHVSHGYVLQVHRARASSLCMVTVHDHVDGVGDRAADRNSFEEYIPCESELRRAEFDPDACQRSFNGAVAECDVLHCGGDCGAQHQPSRMARVIPGRRQQLHAIAYCAVADQTVTGAALLFRLHADGVIPVLHVAVLHHKPVTGDVYPVRVGDGRLQESQIVHNDIRAWRTQTKQATAAVDELEVAKCDVVHVASIEHVRPVAPRHLPPGAPTAVYRAPAEHDDVAHVPHLDQVQTLVVPSGGVRKGLQHSAAWDLEACPVPKRQPMRETGAAVRKRNSSGADVDRLLKCKRVVCNAIASGTKVSRQALHSTVATRLQSPLPLQLVEQHDNAGVQWGTRQGGGACDEQQNGLQHLSN